MTMEERAIRGIPWTLLSFGSAKLFTLLTTVVMARLLNPEDFGLMALALLAFGLLGLIRDLGLGGTIVLRLDFDDRDLGTVLTMMLAAAAAVAVLVIATAPLAAWFLNEPDLTSILAALAATSVFAMVGGFYDCLLQRELEFRKRFAGQMAQSGAFAVVGIALAVAGLGVWSLVLGQIASMVAYSGTLMALSPRRIRPRFDRATARDSFSTGSGFLAQGGLAWLEQNVDYLAVGRILGTAQLGVYSMAYRLSELTHLGIADPIAKVTFPGFARVRHHGGDVTSPYLSTLRLVALVTVAVGAILSGAADPFTRSIFGDEWLSMIGPLSVLGVWAAIKPLEATMGWLVNSVGSAGSLARVTAVLLAPAIPLLIGAAHISATAVAWVVVGQSAVGLVARVVLASRRGGVAVGPQVRATWPIAAAGAAAWASSFGVAAATTALAPVVALTLTVVAGLAAYLLVVTLLAPGTLRFAVTQAGRALGRAPNAIGPPS